VLTPSARYDDGGIDNPPWPSSANLGLTGRWRRSNLTELSHAISNKTPQASFADACGCAEVLGLLADISAVMFQSVGTHVEGKCMASMGLSPPWSPGVKASASATSPAATQRPAFSSWAVFHHLAAMITPAFTRTTICREGHPRAPALGGNRRKGSPLARRARTLLNDAARAGRGMAPATLTCFLESVHSRRRRVCPPSAPTSMRIQAGHCELQGPRIHERKVPWPKEAELVGPGRFIK
jgi:hypothetical protein